MTYDLASLGHITNGEIAAFRRDRPPTDWIESYCETGRQVPSKTV
jgi:hypothetical protein